MPDENSAPAPEAKKRKRGRPPGSSDKKKNPDKTRGRPKKEIEYKDTHIDGLKIVNIPVSKIDLKDDQFKFRVNLRLGSLVESIKGEGQHFPVVLRRREDGILQVISGFRRLEAISKLGWVKVKAVIREDLDADADACKVSIIENELRQTYTDLDRAYAILAYRGMGTSDAEIEDIFMVGQRQRQRLEQLTEFPEILQKAVGEEKVTVTNAVRLMQHAGKFEDYPEMKLNTWIERIVDENMTTKDLNSALQAELAGEKKGKPIEFFVEGQKNGEKSLRIRPIAIDRSLNEEQKESLIGDLEAVLEFVKKL